MIYLFIIDTTFGLQATYELVGLLETLSIQLQSVGLTDDIATICIRSAFARLDEIRSALPKVHTCNSRGIISLEPAVASRPRKLPRVLRISHRRNNGNGGSTSTDLLLLSNY